MFEEQTPSAAQPSIAIDEEEPAIESTETDRADTERVQILGLHTANPVVSYKNQIFSCSWADQIGTELLFAHPEVEPEPDSQIPALKHGPDYDLLAANSVKILGRKADLIPSAGLPQNHLTATATATGTPAPGKPGPPTEQSRFLDRLRAVKQVRGETDTVRTSFPVKRDQNNAERVRGWARTEEQMGQVQRLNQAASAGDTWAVSTLEDLQAQYGSGRNKS